MYWPFGFHCTATGDHSGVGDYIRTCRARGVPVSIFSTDSAGIVLEALESGSHPDDCIGFRFTSIPGVGDVDRLPVDPDTGLYAGDPIEEFEKLYYYHEGYFPPELEEYRSRIWETHINEPNTYKNNNEYNEHDAEYLARGFLHIAKLSLIDGRRYACAGWASGNPHYQFWNHPLTLDYLRLAEQHPTQIGVNWHLYSFNNNDLLANYGDLVGRYKYIYDVCQQEGIAPPYIVAGEFGWGQDKMGASPEDAILQMVAIQNEMIVNRFWGGCCMWTLGAWGGSIVNDMIRLLPYNIDMVINYAPVTIPAIDGGNPVDKPKIVIVKKPQKSEMTEAENETVSKWAWENYGRTTTHSTDDMLTMLAGGNNESYAVLWWAERQPEAEAALLDAGHNYIMMPDDPKPPPAFSFSHYPCQGVAKKINQAFGANPQNYAQFGLPGHEGIDFYAPHGTPIVSVAGGQVYRIETTDNSNYGLQVRVYHGDGHKTVYAHLNNVGVTVGQFVTGGQKIGNADNTGNSFGSHLHLTYKREGMTYTDNKGNVWPSNIFDPTPLIAPLMPTQPPPAGKTIDMLQYFTPVTGSYGPITIKDTSWNGQVRQQIQAHGDYLYVTKGNEFEARQLLNNRIFFIMDDSPGGGKYYTVESADGWIPRYFTEGQEFTRKETARFHYKNNCNPTGEVNNWTNVIKFVKFYPTWTAPSEIVFNDVSHLQWILNGVIEEDYYLAPHCGYAMWKNKHGRQSHIVSMPHGQGNNVFNGACYWPAFGKEWP